MPHFLLPLDVSQRQRRLVVWKWNKGVPLGIALAVSLLHEALSPTLSPGEREQKSEVRYTSFIVPGFEKMITALLCVSRFGGNFFSWGIVMDSVTMRIYFGTIKLSMNLVILNLF